MATPLRAFAGTFGRTLLSPRNVMATRGGAGMRLGTYPPPSQPLPESDELIWDDGNPIPEPCLDVVAPHISANKGLAMLCGGLSVFVAIGYLAKYNDKASRIPWTPREYPYDNLRVELGGDA
eukprot:jgi/Mesen1/3171/ME000184S02236